MELIAQNCIHGKTSVNGLFWASALNINCHACGTLATISFGDHAIDDMRKMVTTSGKCPRCRVITTQISIPGRNEIFTHPSYAKARKAIDEGNFPNEALKRAYESVIKTYNIGEYISAAASCRRALEGILKSMVAADKKNLALNSLIQEITKLNTQRHLVEISHALRKYGNMAAHFEENREPNKEDVEGMIDLFEFLIKYFFVLPGEILKINTRLNAVPASLPASAPASAPTTDPSP